MTEFSLRIIDEIKKIPAGEVRTYGDVAALAGNPRGARQVSRVLHSCSEKYNLPWHRVVGRNLRISLPPGAGMEIQMEKLRNEGWSIAENGTLQP